MSKYISPEEYDLIVREEDVSIITNTNPAQIQVHSNMHIRALYSFCKEQWIEDEGLYAYSFPFMNGDPTNWIIKGKEFLTGFEKYKSIFLIENITE